MSEKDIQAKINLSKKATSSTSTKESELNRLDTVGKKVQSDYSRFTKTTTKLYSVNDSEERKLRDQNIQEYTRIAEKDSNKAEDPYDNTPSSEKMNKSKALAYAQTSQTNYLLERLLQSQNRHAFDDSLLNLQKKQVSLLEIIADNVKALKDISTPSREDKKEAQAKYYEEGVSDLAKQIAAGHFDKAAGTYLKNVATKTDQSGMVGMALGMKDTIKDMIADGGLYQMLKNTIHDSIKTAVFGKELKAEIDKFKEDGALYVQNVLNRAAGSSNEGIRSLAESAFTVNKIDLTRKEEKEDWSKAASFDMKFYKSVTDLIPKGIREIIGAIKGVGAKQFDWDSGQYIDESTMALKEINANRDLLKDARNSFKNELANLFTNNINNNELLKLMTRYVDTDETGHVTRDRLGNAKFKDNAILDILEKFVTSTGGNFDILGDNYDLIVKAMGLNKGDVTQSAQIREVEFILDNLKKAYKKSGSDVKSDFNSLSDIFRDLHDKNTFKTYDGRVDGVEVLQALLDSGTHDISQINKTKDYVNFLNSRNNNYPPNDNNPPSSPPGSGAVKFKGNRYSKSFGDVTDYDMGSYKAAADYFRDQQTTNTSKITKISQSLLSGDVSSFPVGEISKEVDLKAMTPEKKAEILWGIKSNDLKISEDDYGIVSKRRRSSDDDYNKASERIDKEFFKYEKALELYNVIHNAGRTADAMAKLYNKSPNFFIKEGYISSPMDIVKVLNADGTINPTEVRKYKWGYLSDAYIDQEKYRQKEEHNRRNADLGFIGNTGRFISAIWQDPAIQKKLQIGSGTAAGLAIGAMLKNKGIINSNFGVYTMGALGAAIMNTERAKNSMDMLYGKDADKVGSSGFSNRQIMAGKMAEKMLPAAAGLTAATGTFKFTHGIFKALGPMGGIIGLVPSLMASLAVGGVAYKLMPHLKDKVKKAEDGKGIYGKIKEFAKDNKFLSKMFGLEGESSNAKIYHDSLEDTIKEIEVDLNKEIADNPHRDSVKVKTRVLEGLKLKLKDLKDLDKNKNISPEEKDRRASEIYREIVDALKTFSSETQVGFSNRTERDIRERDNAKKSDGVSFSNMEFEDHNKNRIDVAMHKFKNADTLDLNSNIKLGSSKSAGEKVDDYIKDNIKSLSGNSTNSYEAFSKSVNSVKSMLTNTGDIDNNKANDLVNMNKELFKSSLKAKANSTKGIAEVKNQLKDRLGGDFDAIKNKADLDKWIDNHDFGKIDNKEVTRDDLKYIIDNNFGKTLGNLFNSNDSMSRIAGLNDLEARLKELNKENIISDESKLNDVINQEDSKYIEGLREEARNLGITDELGIKNYVVSKIFTEKLQNDNIKLSNDELMKMVADNKFNLFDFMDAKTDSTGSSTVDQLINWTKNNMGESNLSFDTRQVIGEWLLRQLYMTGLGDNPTAADFNRKFDSILKQYVESANSVKRYKDNKILDLLEKGDSGLVDSLNMSDSIKKLRDLRFRSDLSEEDRIDISNSIIMSAINKGELDPSTLKDIIGSQLFLKKEFDNLAKLRQAIVKESDGSNIPLDEHRMFIQHNLDKITSKGILAKVGNKIGQRLFSMTNFKSSDELKEAASDDQVLIDAITMLYDTPNLQNKRKFEYLASEGPHGTVYNWSNTGVWGEDNSIQWPSVEEMYNELQNNANSFDNKNINLNSVMHGIKSRTVAGRGIEEDTLEANQHIADNTVIKMKDLSGSFINGARLDSSGCSIAALHNMLVHMKVPTISRSTMLGIANNYLNKDGVHYKFFFDIAGKLGLEGTIYKNKGNFQKRFFSSLNYTNGFICLLDNVGKDSGSHYITILGMRGDNLSINDPYQPGVSQLSISELSARASLIIEFKTASVALPTGETVKPSISNIEDSSYAGQGFSGNSEYYNAGSMLGSGARYLFESGIDKFKSWREARANKDETKANVPDKPIEGEYDPQVALLATNVSDPNQMKSILGFISSSKNKAFAAAATRFRSLLLKPEMKAELQEKQRTATSELTQEEYLKQIAEKDGDSSGGGKLASLMEALGLGKKGKGGLLGGIGAFAGKMLFGSAAMKKLIKAFKKRFGKKVVEEGTEEAVEQGAEQLTLFGTKEMGEEAAEKLAKEALEETGEQTAKKGILARSKDFLVNKFAKKGTEELAEEAVEQGAKKTTEKVVKRTVFKKSKDLVAKISQNGVKNTVKEAGETVVKQVWAIILKLKTAGPEMLSKTLYNSKVFATYAKIAGKNIDELIPAIVGGFRIFIDKMFTNLSYAKVATKVKSLLGQRLTTKVAGISALLNLGFFAYSWYKGYKNADSLIGEDMDLIEKADLKPLIGLANGVYENGLELLGSLLNLGVTAAGAGLTVGAGMAVEIATTVINMIYQMNVSFKEFALSWFPSIARRLEEAKSGQAKADRKSESELAVLEKNANAEANSENINNDSAIRASANNSTSTISSNNTSGTSNNQRSSDPFDSKGGNDESETMTTITKNYDFTPNPSRLSRFRKWFNTKLKNVKSNPHYTKDFQESYDKDGGSIIEYGKAKGKFNNIYNSGPLRITGQEDKYILALEKAMDEFGITDPEHRAAFMANIDNETGGLVKMSEDLRYSVEGLLKHNFSGVKNFLKSHSMEELEKYIKENGEAGVGELIYGYKYRDKNKQGNNDLGNIEDGDGYKYRGRGLIQITGRDIYDRIGKAIGVDILSNPDLVANDPDVAARSAAAYWVTNKALQKALNKKDYKKSRQIINGGNIGLNEVLALYNPYFKGEGRLQKLLASVKDGSYQANKELAEKKSKSKNVAMGSGKAYKPNSGTLQKYFSENFEYPLNGEREIASTFGYRGDIADEYYRKYGKRMSKYHRGIDLVANTGEPIKSMADGTVSYVGGKMGVIEVTHKDGSVARYLHTSSSNVNVGQEVAKGDVVGAVGKTGTGSPHLHLELSDKPGPMQGNYVDPFFELGLDPKDIRLNEKSPENKRYVEKYELASSSKSKNDMSSKGGYDNDTSYKENTPPKVVSSPNDRVGKPSVNNPVALGRTNGVSKVDNSDVISKLSGLESAITATNKILAVLIKAVVDSTTSSTLSTNNMLGDILNVLKSNNKNDILQQISASRF